jgi:hypothetical protein
MEPTVLSFSSRVATVTVVAGVEQALAAHSDGAEGEKSAGMAGAVLLVFGSKGAAEQTWIFGKRPRASGGPFFTDATRAAENNPGFGSLICSWT